MEVGQQSKSIGFIVQARMQSERLPGKVMLPLPFPDGKPILSHIVEALKQSTGTIIVATSDKKENNLIEDFCTENNITCYRGSETDVLSRFAEIQLIYNFDHIIRFTADNPIIDRLFLNKTLTFHIEEQNDYTYSTGLPLGMNFEIIKGTALLDSINYTVSESDKEHVTSAIRRESFFKKGNYNTKLNLEHVRLTVDTPSDLLVAGTILRLGECLNLSDSNLINKIATDYSWLLNANKHIFQKNNNLDKHTELKNALNLLNELEYYHVASIIKKETL